MYEQYLISRSCCYGIIINFNLNTIVFLGTGDYKRWFTFITRGQFWPSGIVIACVCVCVRQSSVCPDDNLSPAQATITKFGPEVQNTLTKIPIVF